MCPDTPEGRLVTFKIPYREAVGCLLWLAMGTRPDICYAVSQVAKFNDNPGPEHWNTVLRIFKYLQGSIDYVIEYRTSSADHHNHAPVGCFSPCLDHPNEMIPTGFVDSDHARDPDTRRSVTGYAFTLAEAPIVWQSRQQVSVALSSMEAEYMAACAATQEAVWLRAVLVEIDAGFINQLFYGKIINRVFISHTIPRITSGVSISIDNIIMFENRSLRVVLVWTRLIPSLIVQIYSRSR